MDMYDLILQNIARYIQLTPEETDFFISVLQIKKLRKKQYLVQEGDVCRYESFVNKGCLRTYHVDEKGQEHIAQFAIEGWWISDMYSFLTSTPARLNVDAMEDAELLCIDKPSLEELYLRVPKFERFFRIILQNAFIAHQQRIIANMSKSAEERYLEFLERYPELEQRVPQHQIASYLGITPESLSRIRKQLTERS
jgi:CRP-like cAMP-binding protein